MLISMDSGASGLEQFQQDLNVIGNNIANVDTVGYKSNSMNFADNFSQALGSTSVGTTQIGTGVRINLQHRCGHQSGHQWQWLLFGARSGQQRPVPHPGR